MHETSIVRSIIRTLEDEFEEEKLRRMSGIYIKIGILSNIEPQLMQSAYHAHGHDNEFYHDIPMYIEVTDIKIQCETCNHITDVKNYRFICDKCGLPSKNLIQGEEMLIHKVEFQD